MKSLSIATLALVLALSGCSSSPSIEEETESKLKLIEYELCLEEAREVFKDVVGTPEGKEQAVLKTCEDKRP